ncbi:LOW QUALITY PROTEIN: uncharacterized protein RCH25_037997 [Pelodytes ibericus]
MVSIGTWSIGNIFGYLGLIFSLLYSNFYQFGISHAKQTVGIFSRDAEDHYSWLQTLLRSQGFRDHILEVRPCHISDPPQFREDVSRCTFGILYHTKNRGRVNVTDVMGSLYDEELKDLSVTLGKGNVIVIIDDLDHCTSEEKDRILQHQPSIGRLAQDLFLFSREKKSHYGRHLQEMQEKDIGEMPENIKTIIDLIRAAGVNLPPTNAPLSPGGLDTGRTGDTALGEDSTSRVPAHLMIVTQHLPSHECYSAPAHLMIVTQYLPSHECYSAPAHLMIVTQHLPSHECYSAPAHLMIVTQYLPSHECYSAPAHLMIVTRHLPSHECYSFGISHAKQTVGIFSRDAEDHYSWLQTLLRSQGFRDHILEVRPCHISDPPQVREDVSRCTFGILYHTKNRGRVNVTDVTDSLYDDELEYLSVTLGKGNVIVIIDDLDHCTSEEKDRILQHQPSIGRLARDLLLFSREEKSHYGRHLQEMQEKDIGEMPENIKTIIDLIRAADQIPSNDQEVNIKKHTVGIFSRSAEGDYSWLQTLLTSGGFREVRPCYISNSGRRQFREDVSRCTFAILYHTKNRGRVNVTDVTDSLYDEELRYLSEELGRERVLVLIDDLEDSSPEQKIKILKDQPSIRKLARNLLLISCNEKRQISSLSASCLKKMKKKNLVQPVCNSCKRIRQTQ